MRVLYVVGILGLEPRMTGPESVVLPLHHIPIIRHPFVLFASAKVRKKSELQTFLPTFF